MDKAGVTTNRFIVALLFLVASAAATPALAAGTAAGTSISNGATINYQVNSIAQDAIVGTPVTFVVDRKINLTVATTDVAAVSVTPGSTARVLTFTVTNTGNGTQDFALSAIAVATAAASKFGGNDTINASSVSVFVESGATPGYQVGEDTATFIDELAADGVKTVYIVANFPTGLANNDIASYHLLAEARAGGSAGGAVGAALTETAGGDTAGSEDTVFADGQGTATASDASRDAKHSAQSDYKVSTATLSVTKTSAVISDPFNAGTNPKAIPGAVVEYTIQIDNAAGAATATNVTISDSLNGEITSTPAHLAFNANTYGAGSGIQVTAPNINGGLAKALTNAGADDEGDWNVTGTNVVTVSGITLTASQTATIKFRVTIQ